MSEHDDIWADPNDLWGAQYGEAVTVVTPAGAERPCTGIVTRAGARMTESPRDQQRPTHVSLPNSAAQGVSFGEWNNRFSVRLAQPGQASVTMRTVRVLHGSAGSDRLELELA